MSQNYFLSKLANNGDCLLNHENEINKPCHNSKDNLKTLLIDLNHGNKR